MKQIYCNDDDQGDLTINIEDGVTSEPIFTAALGMPTLRIREMVRLISTPASWAARCEAVTPTTRWKAAPATTRSSEQRSYGNFVDGGGGDNTIILAAPQFGTIFGGSDPNASTTLELIEAPGDEVASLLPDNGSVEVSIARPDGSDLISLLVYDVSRLILDPGHGNNTVTVGDLSTTSLQELDIDVTHPDTFGGNHVTIVGSPGEDDLGAYLSTDPVSKQSAFLMNLEHLGTAPGSGTNLGIKIVGLVAADTLTLDGGGGTNSFALFVSANTPFDIALQDSGPGADDTLNLLGNTIPSGSLDISDSAVTFDFINRSGVLFYSDSRQIELDGNVRHLVVAAPTGNETITAERNIGDTGITGFGGDYTYNVSGLSSTTSRPMAPRLLCRQPPLCTRRLAISELNRE